MISSPKHALGLLFQYLTGMMDPGYIAPQGGTARPSNFYTAAERRHKKVRRKMRQASQRRNRQK